MFGEPAVDPAPIHRAPSGRANGKSGPCDSTQYKALVLIVSSPPETVLSKRRGTTNEGSGTGSSASALKLKGAPAEPRSASSNEITALSPAGSPRTSSEERTQALSVSFRTISGAATSPLSSAPAALP